jgi:hypothetical protein
MNKKIYTVIGRCIADCEYREKEKGDCTLKKVILGNDGKCAQMKPKKE